MKGRRRPGALPVVRIADGVVLIDAVKTPHGWVAFALTGRGLRATRFMHRTRGEALRRLKEERRLRGLVTESAPAKVAKPWAGLISDVFVGEPCDLTRVPVDDRGWTDFSRNVYRYVRRIPRGEVRTYGQVARAIGRPGAARAVGRAMARNPVAPIVPCHRVVGSDGSLCGFSAYGGLKLKAKMLAREGKLAK